MMKFIPETCCTLLTLSVPDEIYSRNVLYTLN